MTRKTMRDAIVQDLQETTELTDANVDRAIDQAVHELSRYVPEENVFELIVDKDVTDEAFTSNHGTAVSLANSPIIWSSETVTNSGGTITYTRNTDYTFDYLNGTITTLAAGAMVDATSHLIDYTKDYKFINVSGLLTNPRRLLRLEKVSADRVEALSFDVFGNFIHLLTSTGGGSQTQPGDSIHLRIFYLAERELGALDTDVMSGLHQEYLEEMVIRGGAGFALRMIARANEAVLELTFLTNMATDSVSRLNETSNAVTAGTGVQVTLDSIGAILAVVRGQAGAPYDDALTALGKVATNLDTGARAADDALLELDTELATALTALQAIRGTATEPFDEALAALLLVNDQTITNADIAADKINAEITAINTAINNITSDIAAIRVDTAAALANLESDTRNADKYLDEGDAFLNQVNTGGPGVPQDYVAFAQGKMAMASAFIANAQQEVGVATARVGEARVRVDVVTSRIQEVQTRISLVGALIAEANGYNDLSISLIREAEVHVSMALAHGQEAARWQESAALYIAEARGRIEAGGLVIAEASTNIALAVGYSEEVRIRIAMDKDYQDSIDVGGRAIATGLQLVEITNREADVRLGEFRNMIRSFAESHTQPSHIVATGQWKA